MRILVFGAGAVGSLVGALLGQVGHDLTLVRLDAPVADRASLVLDRPDGSRVELQARLRPAAPDVDDSGGNPELIVLGVKMFSLGDALDACERWPGVPVLTIQNGIGAEEAVARRRSGGSIAASLTAAVEVGPDGSIHQLARGGIGLATVTGSTRALAEGLAADFRAAGMRSRVLPDYVAMKWSKTLANLVANATSAILDMDPSAIYGRSELFAVERDQMLETLAVIRALGRRPTSLPGAPVPWLARGYRVPAALGRPILARIVGGARGGKLPSLRLATRRGESPTEVAWLNGAVAKYGHEHEVRTPVNECLARLVDEVAASPERATWFRGRPDRLLDALQDQARQL